MIILLREFSKTISDSILNRSTESKIQMVFKLNWMNSLGNLIAESRVYKKMLEMYRC